MNRFDPLHVRAPSRLARYKAAAQKSATDQRRRPDFRKKYARPGAWKTVRWITPHGLGLNAPEDVGFHPFKDGRAANVAWGIVDGWRDVGDADAIVSLLHRGWYSDAHETETYRGHVWQLPARDRAPRYVAGYVEHQSAGDDGRHGGYVVLSCERGRLEMFDSKEDAARAADSLAESRAETDREYSERWHAASEADSTREDAREDLSAARAKGAVVIAALREEPGPKARGVLVLALADARESMREAIEKIETARERIAELEMAKEF